MRVLKESNKSTFDSSVSGTVYCSYPIVPFGVVACTFFPTTFLEIVTSAEREVEDSRRSGMYQSYHFLTRLGMQSQEYSARGSAGVEPEPSFFVMIYISPGQFIHICK